MENLYDSPEGQLLLEKTQGVSEKAWFIIKCKKCFSKYDMRLVEWDGDCTTICPVCGRAS